MNPERRDAVNAPLRNCALGHTKRNTGLPRASEVLFDNRVNVHNCESSGLDWLSQVPYSTLFGGRFRLCHSRNSKKPMAAFPMATFAKRVESLRKAAGLNQPQLAKKAGVTKGLIWQIEQGRNQEVKMLQLFKLAAALGVGARFLATGLGSPVALGQVDNDEGELVSLYRLCSDRHKDNILESARSFAKEADYQAQNKQIAKISSLKAT